MSIIRQYITLFLLLSATSFAQSLTVTNLLSEYRPNPIGVQATKPSLNWKLVSQQLRVQ